MKDKELKLEPIGVVSMLRLLGRTTPLVQNPFWEVAGLHCFNAPYPRCVTEFASTD